MINRESGSSPLKTPQAVAVAGTRNGDAGHFFPPAAASSATNSLSQHQNGLPHQSQQQPHVQGGIDAQSKQARELLRGGDIHIPGLGGANQQ